MDDEFARGLQDLEVRVRTMLRKTQKTRPKPASLRAAEVRLYKRRTYNLIDALGFIPKSTSDQRARLRSAVPENDVGYLITLLNAMYQEDVFSRWVYRSTYVPQGKPPDTEPEHHAPMDAEEVVGGLKNVALQVQELLQHAPPALSIGVELWFSVGRRIPFLGLRMKFSG